MPIDIRPHRYLVYLVGGGLAAVLTIASREVFAVLLPADNRLYFMVSILLAYGVGIAFNFQFQKRVTFRLSDARDNAFLRYTIVALIGMLLVMMLSYLFRYRIGFERWFAPYDDTLAFALASLLTSVATYGMTVWSVFHAAPQCREGSEEAKT